MTGGEAASGEEGEGGAAWTHRFRQQGPSERVQWSQNKAEQSADALLVN